MKEKAAYLKGLIDGLGIDENTKEGKVIKAMSELLDADDARIVSRNTLEMTVQHVN